MTNAVAIRQETSISMDEIERMAVAVAKSGLFGVKTADQALALMLVAHAEGMHPAIAARDYHIIEGRPAMKADAMLARFQSAGGRVKWTVMTEEKVAAVFSHPQGGDVEIAWTMEMAKNARLSTKTQRDGGPNMWQKFPRQMLRARVVSEGIRTVFPGVLVGTYTPEEITDMEPTRQMADVTPAPAEPASPRPTRAETAAPLTLYPMLYGEGAGQELTGTDWLVQAEIALGSAPDPVAWWEANEATFYQIQEAATEKRVKKAIAACDKVLDLAHKVANAQQPEQTPQD